MRILLGSNALYYPAHGGGERSNRMVFEGLSERGHKCFVITRIDRFGPEGESNLRNQLESRGIVPRSEPGALRFELNGVEVLAATGAPSFRAFFVEHKNWFRPDVIVTSTDDPAQLLLEAALHDEHAPTVFLTTSRGGAALRPRRRVSRAAKRCRCCGPARIVMVSKLRRLAIYGSTPVSKRFTCRSRHPKGDHAA